VAERSAGSESAPTVVACGVDVSYRMNGERFPAVRGVSLVAYRGEAIGLVGANGSGKSTLLRALAGLLPVDAGEIFASARPTLLGVNAALMPDLSGAQNIHLGGRAMGMSRADVGAAYPGIVEFSGVNERGDFISQPMRAYSSGMAARLRFAIAAARDHEILLIDEALATGDRAFRKKSAARVRELRERAGTVFLVSHDHASVREMCSRVVWLDAGRVRLDGPTEEVLAAYERG
jgi:teichoic acid transport system ATP-binding protein